MSNRLQQASSPYLLQHKDNPVDWYPWSDEAFEEARTRDKPIFLSVGYSTCHWCHVMAHESFEDEQVAALMNETFVSVKVDREERPDVDGVYMTVCQMMTGSGGWPLTIIMTPDKRPFFAATYIPREGRFGRMGMLELVPRIDAAWASEREKLISAADRVVGALQEQRTPADSDGTVTSDALDDAYRWFSSSFDPVHGGFGSAPKFPSPHNLMFLLRVARGGERPEATRMVVETLEKMRLGGIYDHLGYGFHRYATDAEWMLPHFEKMLYDQALLAITYVEAYQVTGRELFADTAHEIFAYVLRDMTSPEGAFYSAEDADSEGREGAYYVWTTEEVERLLGDDALLLFDAYGLEVEGNFEEEATGRKTGENVLHLRVPPEEIAHERGVDERYVHERLESARRRLLEHRSQRVRPGRDDKVLVDWNGLMIAAFAKAAQVFGDERCAETAHRAADFILEHLRDDEGRLLHRYREGEAGIQAHLDDYAYFTWGLIELYHATFDLSMLETAIELTNQLLEHFEDAERGGFFFTADDAEELVVRQKILHDGALPSGNAITLLNLLRLSRMTGDDRFDAAADRIVGFAGSQVRQMPSAFAGLLMGIDFALAGSQEVVVAGPRGQEDVDQMLRVLQTSFLPHAVLLFRADEEERLAALAPFTAAQEPVDGCATAYVCTDFQCAQPTTDPREMLELLKPHEVKH